MLTLRKTKSVYKCFSIKSHKTSQANVHALTLIENRRFRGILWKYTFFTDDWQFYRTCLDRRIVRGCSMYYARAVKGAWNDAAMRPSVCLSQQRLGQAVQTRCHHAQTSAWQGSAVPCRLSAGSVSGQPHSNWWWCRDIDYPLLDAKHSLCTATWSGTPCRTTSAHSRTTSPLERAWKPGFSLDTSEFSALETFVIIALYKSTFTVPYHTIP